MSVHAFPPDVRVLLPSEALFVITVLRRFGAFRQAYDQAHLDHAALAIRERLGEWAVDGLMSDILLVDNELRLRTSGGFRVKGDGSPAATHDEIALVRIIAALQANRYRQAAEAAVALGVVQSRTLLLLVNRLAARLSQFKVRLDQGVLCPSIRPAARHARHRVTGTRPQLTLVASA